jgi:hypothetical protein
VPHLFIDFLWAHICFALMMKLLEKRNGGKRNSNAVGAHSPLRPKGNYDAEECNAEGGECDVDQVEAVPRGAAHATYGAVDGMFGIDEESSDASSQYSNKMGLLTAEDLKAGNDAEHYLGQSALGRAYPERFFALLVTLMLELPTLFIISGGSDKLCALIGRRR